MTLLELLAVIATGGGSLGAGVAGVIAATKRSPKPKHSDPPTASLQPPRLPRSEQIPEWARDTWTRERAEKEAAMAAAEAADIEARRDQRERIAALERANNNHVQQLGRIDFRLTAIESGQREQTAVLGTVRDAVLVMRAQCPQCEDSDPAPVIVRGGAAAR